MALKYSLKLIFLKFIFEFMINTTPQASNSINGREKRYEFINFPSLTGQGTRGPAGVWEVQSRAGVNYCVFSALFFFSSYFFPFACFVLFSLVTLFSFTSFLR